MERTELRIFIINEIKTKRPDDTDPEGMADFILSQPSMQSEAGIKGFLRGYLKNDKENN